MQQPDSHTGSSDTHIHVRALLSMRHKDRTETNMKQSKAIRHTQSHGKELTVLRSAVGLRAHMSDRTGPQVIRAKTTAAIR